MTPALIVRRAVLIITAVVFAAIAVASLVAPHKMAKPLGYELISTNALNEYRAIYVGLWLAHAVVLVWAARRIDLVHLGDVAGILLLGQVLGRIISAGLDGMPDARLFPVAIAEVAGGVLIMALRR